MRSRATARRRRRGHVGARTARGLSPREISCSSHWPDMASRSHGTEDAHDARATCRVGERPMNIVVVTASTRDAPCRRAARTVVFSDWLHARHVVYARAPSRASSSATCRRPVMQAAPKPPPRAGELNALAENRNMSVAAAVFSCRRDDDELGQPPHHTRIAHRASPAAHARPLDITAHDGCRACRADTH